MVNTRKNYTHKRRTKSLRLRRRKTQKAGCDFPGFPDGDDVWERTNGIISGKFYSVLQFYKFIDWSKCNQMYKLRNKKVNVSGLKSITEGELNAALDGYIIYDATGQIKNTPSPSFLFGTAEVDTDKQEVILNQAQEDMLEGKQLSFKFDYDKPINVVIVPSPKKPNTKSPENRIFFFTDQDASFTLGLKTGWKMPGTYIKEIMAAQVKSREISQKQKQQLSVDEKQQKEIFRGTAYASQKQ
jgi:hypothetical protein